MLTFECKMMIHGCTLILFILAEYGVHKEGPYFESNNVDFVYCYSVRLLRNFGKDACGDRRCRAASLILLIERRVNCADHELDHPHIWSEVEALLPVLLRLQLVVGGRVHHLADHGVFVKRGQERLRALILAHLRGIVR